MYLVARQGKTQEAAAFGSTTRPFQSWWGSNSVLTGGWMTAAPDEKDDDLRKFFKAWAWKREHRPDRDRFHKPYVHSLAAGGAPLTIKQAKFSAAGFASTVWDSSIVVARYLEARPHLVAGRACLDLSAGCGLVGIVAARLGASRAVATDLPENLPLLDANCQTNAPGLMAVYAHTWGEDISPLGPPFDVVLAADVMYVREAVPALLSSLQALCRRPAAPHGHVILAHGRNRFAEDDFMSLAAAAWCVRVVGEEELHPDFSCSDVTVYDMTLKT